MPDFMNTETAAAELGITPQYLGVLIREGAIRAYRGARRKYLLDPKDVARYKRDHPSDANPVLITPSKEAR